MRALRLVLLVAVLALAACDECEPGENWCDGDVLKRCRVEGDAVIGDGKGVVEREDCAAGEAPYCVELIDGDAACAFLPGGCSGEDPTRCSPYADDQLLLCEENHWLQDLFCDEGEQCVDDGEEGAHCE